ncbi:hypothetical protein CVT26_010209 [Gymnopilus dilepis]|uniref:Uncharacterized protein n=1 Tax=Gymnopilus dilepis TaxID=231916 RepID=A0A409X4B4_9AGAR|nr:hypothetical protein CVT26_010209 [Gymnopilus dilepis]
MTGRFSMEQARAIKEKRELEQELLDVKAFEAKIIGQSSRRRSAPTKNLKEISSGSESGEERGSGSEEDEAPKKRSTTARKSIMAFLEDQSDEE